MSAIPSLSATLPAPVHTALVMTAIFDPSADTCLSIAAGILHEMREATEPDEPAVGRLQQGRRLAGAA